MNIKPIGNKVLVEMRSAEALTKGGIHLPGQFADPTQDGFVRGLGTGGTNSKGERIPFEVAIGDHVLFGSRYAGKEIESNGKNLRVVNVEEILAVLPWNEKV